MMDSGQRMVFIARMMTSVDESIASGLMTVAPTIRMMTSVVHNVTDG